MGKTLVAWMLVAGAVAAPAAGPREVVQAAVSRVVSAVQRANRPEIRRVAADLFDFDEMARRALPRHWATRTAEEQAEFIRLFTDLLARSYLGRVEAYSGEKIVYLGESVDGDWAAVRSKVITKRNTETPLDYRLRLRDGRWRVYDVLIDHVSFVSTYRSEFTRILHKESYAALVDRLRRQSVEAAAVR
jgi:phospholipid transport system substrate-binding protein